jgi:hypothetical protein
MKREEKKILVDESLAVYRLGFSFFLVMGFLNYGGGFSMLSSVDSLHISIPFYPQYQTPSSLRGTSSCTELYSD